MNQKELDLIKNIINRYIDNSKNKVFVFGSQATGKISRSSENIADDVYNIAKGDFLNKANGLISKAREYIN